MMDLVVFSKKTEVGIEKPAVGQEIKFVIKTTGGMITIIMEPPHSFFVDSLLELLEKFNVKGVVDEGN